MDMIHMSLQVSAAARLSRICRAAFRRYQGCLDLHDSDLGKLMAGMCLSSVFVMVNVQGGLVRRMGSSANLLVSP